jgi:uncharacterized protein
MSTTDTQTGVFAGPICGLRFETPKRSGITNDRGEFQYGAGECVTFSIGGLVLGSIDGTPRVNLAQLVNRADGKVDRLHDPMVTNLARFVQTLDEDGDFENGITIASSVHDLISPIVLNFNQAATDAAEVDGTAHGSEGIAAMVAFSTDQMITFASDPAVTGLLATLNAKPGAFTANTPRRLRNGAAVRNELRRNIRGFVKLTDVRIPLRDGSYVCADVFLPAEDGQYPVVMNQGFYGVIGSDKDAQHKEEMEDRYFTGNPDGLQYENHESVDSSIWVPEGYVCIRVDARGVGNSPGLQAPFSVQQAEDYYDAIEWAGSQPWSNGNVGLWGMSYLAITQHTVASLRPPHLKAMIAIGTDSDLYNEAFYGGGLYGEGFWTWWRMAMTGHNYNADQRQETDWFSRMLATPFNDPEAYGPQGSIFMRPEIEKATAPAWIVGPQTGVVIHQLGSSETFIHSTGVQSKKFDFVDAWFPHSYKNSTIADHQRFFDHWLKGEDNCVMDGAPVRVQTHLKADYQPLGDGEVVYVEVGLNPSSAVIRKGCRLRVDIQPYSPAGIPSRAYDENYHAGATNTIYTGPDHPSYVQLPIVPKNS